VLPGRLRASLTVVDGSCFSEMESWRRAPTRVSGPGLVKALDRAADLEGLGVRSADCSTVPANRIAALARYGLASKAPTLQELAEPRRTATLLAMARHLDAVAIDDALDLFALLMATRLINPARAASATERLASLPRLERASRMLAVAHRELFKTLDAAAQVETGLDVAAIWAVLEQVASREQLADAVGVVEELVPADDGSAESAMRVVLGERYRTVRPFLGLLGNSGSLAAAAGGAKVLAAVKALPELAARKVTTKPLRDSDIDADLVPPMWQRAVYANPGLAQGAVDRDAYVVCVLEQLHKALRVRDIFAAPSHRWADPRAQLLVGPAWEAVRPEILDGLGLALPVHEHLRGMVMVLDAAWTQLADRLTEAGDASTMRYRAWRGRAYAAVGGTPRRLGHPRKPDGAAGTDRGDAAAHRPARAAAGSARLDRVPARLRPRVRGADPDERSSGVGGRAAHRRGMQRRLGAGHRPERRSVDPGPALPRRSELSALLCACSTAGSADRPVPALHPARTPHQRRQSRMPPHGGRP